ncbi:hypothetical protein AX774_g4654 [Zancudomyces culisetae]|uniref:Uncharacterized protein n=1 Tax=Zancudomyces culisetae TaxID=1213189 RepID=A0A1R1PLN8_ZANCU|nr:hypothetical protein AX774_g4654 [Zancudomyces culisetae]|eukprot:OMH81880.1 hypothetical protein AX774_g4654 [Zancudomyces culisetae]
MVNENRDSFIESSAPESIFKNGISKPTGGLVRKKIEELNTNSGSRDILAPKNIIIDNAPEGIRGQGRLQSPLSIKSSSLKSVSTGFSRGGVDTEKAEDMTSKDGLQANSLVIEQTENNEGIDGDRSSIRGGKESLDGDSEAYNAFIKNVTDFPPAKSYSRILSSPPLSKKQSTNSVNRKKQFNKVKNGIDTKSLNAGPKGKKVAFDQQEALAKDTNPGPLTSDGLALISKIRGKPKSGVIINEVTKIKPEELLSKAPVKKKMESQQQEMAFKVTENFFVSRRKDSDDGASIKDEVAISSARVNNIANSYIKTKREGGNVTDAYKKSEELAGKIFDKVYADVNSIDKETLLNQANHATKNKSKSAMQLKTDHTPVQSSNSDKTESTNDKFAIFDNLAMDTGTLDELNKFKVAEMMKAKSPPVKQSMIRKISKLFK